MAFFKHSSNVNEFSYATCVLPSTELRAVLPSTPGQCSRCLKTKYVLPYRMPAHGLAYVSTSKDKTSHRRQTFSGVERSDVEWSGMDGVVRSGAGWNGEG